MAAAGQDGSIPDPNFLTTSLRDCLEGMEEKKGFGSGGWCGEGRRGAWEAGGGVGLEAVGRLNRACLSFLLDLRPDFFPAIR